MSRCVSDLLVLVINERCLRFYNFDKLLLERKVYILFYAYIKHSFQKCVFFLFESTSSIRIFPSCSQRVIFRAASAAVAKTSWMDSLIHAQQQQQQQRAFVKWGSYILCVPTLY